MTINSISGIFELIYEVFGDSATRIANIYTTLCNSRRHGVVDTSLGYDCLDRVNCRNGSGQFLSVFLFLFFILYFT